MFICNKCNCGKDSCGDVSKKNIAKLGKDISAISVSSKLQLLFLLSTENHCVCDLVGHTGLSQSLISHHLSDFVASGHVENKKEGKYREYSLTDKGKKTIKAMEVLLGKEVE
jgi:DNA-binding transcriptional ArsR family regulator